MANPAAKGGSKAALAISMVDADGTKKLQAPPTPGAQAPAPRAPWARDRAKAVLVCSVYMTVGPTLIVLNSKIMNEVGFRYPMSLSCLGLFASALAAFFLVHVAGVVQITSHPELTPWFYATRCLPVGLLTAATLATGNTVYLYLSVAFIQMLKAFTPVITLCCIYAAGLEAPRVTVVAAVTGIAVSTALAAYGELNFSAVGVAIMVISAGSEGVRLVITQTMLTDFKFTVVEGLYYLAPASVAFLLVAIGYSEAADMWEEWEVLLELVQANSSLFLLSAALGVVVNFLSFLVIQATSSVTLKVLAAARNAGLIIFCAVFLGEIVTGLQFLGYSVALVFFGYYNYLRMSAK